MSSKDRLIGNLFTKYNKTVRHKDTFNPAKADAKLTNFTLIRVVSNVQN